MKIYARANDDGIVTHFLSAFFETPLDTDFLIEDGKNDYNYHVHLKYRVLDDLMRYNYKLENGALIERTDAEKAADITTSTEPTIEDRVSDMESAIVSMVYGGTA